MLGKDLSQALGNISPELVTEAMTVQRKGRAKAFWTRAVALAATIAIVLTVLFWPGSRKDGFVTAPGILKVYANESATEDPDKNLITNMFVEGTKYEPVVWSMLTSAYVGIPITLVLPDGYYGDAEITFDIHTDEGEFMQYVPGEHYESVGKDCVMTNGQKVYWIYLYVFDADNASGGIYVEIVIRADGKPVGYAIVEMGGIDAYFFPVRAETVCYPMIDGQYQNVSEIDINLGIEELKEVCNKEFTLEEKRAEYREYFEKKSKEED